MQLQISHLSAVRISPPVQYSLELATDEQLTNFQFAFYNFQFSILFGRQHRIKRCLRLAPTVEQQRVAGSASNWPVIQPRIAVSDPPESHAVNHVPVVHEHAK